jgi:hypothetical protein
MDLIGIAKRPPRVAAMCKRASEKELRCDLSNKRPCSSLEKIIRRHFMSAAFLTLTAFYISDVHVSLSKVKTIGKPTTR